jgi:threonine dehydrogenase-like Zn-dependent dehydrogenase
LVLEHRVNPPVPAPGEALIRVTRVAICREDLEEAKRVGTGNGPGAVPGAASVTLGSQFVGLVEKVSPVLSGTTSGWEPRRIVGKLVAVNPDIACGKCDLCQRGLASHCRARVSLGSQRDGGLADLVCVPLSNLHVVPEHVDDDRAVFAASVAAAAHTAMQLRVEGRPYITVLGDGPVGLLTAQVLSRLNASVRVLGKHEAKLELCAKWGVKHRLASEAGLRADQDVVIDCTGTREGLEAALKMVRPRGKVLVKAVPTGAVDIAPVVAGEIELLGSRGGSIPEALSLIAREQVDVVSLISRRFKLDAGIEAMRAAASAETLRVLVEP